MLNISTRKFTIGLNFICFLTCLILNLRIPNDPSVWSGFSDPADYLHQSQISLLDKEFYAPHHTATFYPRPFTVPLFYKIAGRNPDNICQMQKIIHSLSIFFLVSALLLYIRKDIIKCLLILCIYFLMSWWNILGWSILLLSESLSMSLLFCWIASFIYLLKKRNTFTLVTHLFIAILFSFTRDSWPYIFIAFYALTTAGFYLWEKSLVKKSVLLLVSSVIIFFVQQNTAKIGQRYKLPIINTTIVRIIPDTSYTQWFVKEGMPCSNRLVKNFRTLGPLNDTSKLKIYNLYTDTSYNQYFDWVITKGQSTYLKFMITHPCYTFLLNEPSSQLRRIFACNLFYTGDFQSYSRPAQFVFPLFNPIIVLLLCLILILLFRQKKSLILLLPVCLALIFAFNAWLSYNADALEVERHLFITQIMTEFLGFFALALIMDNLTDKRQLKQLFSIKDQLHSNDKAD